MEPFVAIKDDEVKGRVKEIPVFVGRSQIDAVKESAVITIGR
jgi:hypothetical protein